MVTNIQRPTFIRLEPVGLDDLNLELGRLRCPPPSRVEAVRLDLGRNGQLSPLVARLRATEAPELLDGFKRVRAARVLGWKTLEVGYLEASSALALALMLSLNRRFGLSHVEEAMVVRELNAGGLTGTEVGLLLNRHKTWVSRRLGLLNQLAPELQEDMRLGLLEPGVARRLLPLPRGNQVELAAVVGQAKLGVKQTEALVKLWRQAPSQEARRYVTTHPKEALAAHNTKPTEARVDPRLSSQGQQIYRHLHHALEATGRLEDTLRWGIAPEDRGLLSTAIDDLTRRMTGVTSLLGSSSVDGSSTASTAGKGTCESES